MTKRYAAQISALAIALVFISCALFTIPISADTGSYQDSDTGSAVSSISSSEKEPNTNTGTNITKTGTISNILGSMMIYLNNTPTGSGGYEHLSSTLYIDSDTTISSSSILDNNSKVIFSNDATLIVDGCSLCIGGNVSFIGNVSISLTKDASLYLGNIGIIKPENDKAFSIESPSFDLEFNTENTIAYTEKKAKFHFSIDIKEDAPLKIIMVDGATNGFEMYLGYNPDGKEWYTDVDLSLGEFVEFIDKKYKGTEEDYGSFTFRDFLDFVLGEEDKIPKADIEIYIHDLEYDMKLRSTDKDGKTTDVTNGTVIIKEFDLNLSSYVEGTDDYKLYTTAEYDYIFVDVENKDVLYDVVATSSSSKKLYLESSGAYMKITSNVMTYAYIKVDSFTYKLDKNGNEGAANSIAIGISETELNLKITSSGAIGFLNMFKSMFEAPNRVNKILTSTDLTSLTANSAVSLDTKLISISYKDKSADLDENRIIFSLVNASMESILPANNVRFNADSFDIEVIWQSYSYSDDGKTYYTEINSSESCKDIDLFIDAKDTTPDELVKLVVEILELDVKQETIDSIMDYKKNINMTIELEIGTNLLKSDTTKSLCTVMGKSVVERVASSFELDGASIDIKVDTSGNNTIAMKTDLFELSLITGGIGLNPNYENEYSEVDTFVVMCEFDFSAYASYGHMYKLLTGAYLYMLDEEHTITVSSIDKIVSNFLIQDSSKTKINLNLKYAEIGTRIDTYIDTEIINTEENVVYIGDKNSKTQDISVELLVNIEYRNMTVFVKDSHIIAMAKNDAAIMTKTTSSNNGVENTITGKSAMIKLSIGTDAEGISAEKIKNSLNDAMKKISVNGSISWGTFTSKNCYVDSASGNTYSESVHCVDSYMKIDSTLGTLSSAIHNYSADMNMLMATRDLISDYSEESISTTTEVTDIHGKVIAWKRFAFTGITITFFDNTYSERAKHVDADVNWNCKYDLYTDGSVYFKNVFKLNSGYVISDGTNTLDDSNGKMIYVDSFSTTESSVLCGGITDAAVGTKLALTKPDDLTYNGYAFRGWNIGDIFVEATDDEVTYYAPPSGTFTITYAYGYVLTTETNGGSPADDICAHDEDYIDVSKLSTSREGYTFAGWNCEELTGTGKDRMPAKDAKIYAIWVPNVYSVSFDANGGSINGNLLNTAKYTFDSDFILPTANSMEAPYKEGYTITLIGWYEANDSTKTVVTEIKNVMAGNLRYIAVWQESPNAYDITIDANGGSLNTTKITFHTDEKIDVSSVTGTMDGYVLSSLQGYTAGMTMPARSITFKAVWAKVITDELIKEETDKVTLNTDSEAVKLSKDDIESLIEKSQDKNIEITFSDILVNLSPEAIKKLSKDNYGNYSDMNMSVVRSTVSDVNLSSEKKSLIKEIISINVNSKGVSNDLGYVNISIPLSKELSGTSYKVYYLNNDEMTEMETVCTEENGIITVSFSTSHFSDYVIMAEEQPKAQDSNISMYVIIGIAVAALVLLGIVVYARKVKQ